jgi:hypothetical protein
MIGAEMRAFFIISKDFKHSSSNSKGASLAKRFVRGVAMYEKIFYKAAIKSRMTKKTMDPFDICGRR